MIYVYGGPLLIWIWVLSNTQLNNIKGFTVVSRVHLFSRSERLQEVYKRMTFLGENAIYCHIACFGFLILRDSRIR